MRAPDEYPKRHDYRTADCHVIIVIYLHGPSTLVHALADCNADCNAHPDTDADLRAARDLHAAERD